MLPLGIGRAVNPLLQALPGIGEEEVPRFVQRPASERLADDSEVAPVVRVFGERVAGVGID
jgi:hypothetical protein